MDCTRRRRHEEALALKLKHRGPEVYFRGLIEISNKCRKNCLYCGIRGGNCNVQRYEMTDEQVLQEAQFALDAGYGSIAIQGGERSDSAFIERITRLLYQIRRLQPGGASCANTNNLGITLSLGEQSREVYREWKNAGASRYLLRIEASNRDLYEKIHPGFALTGSAQETAHNTQQPMPERGAACSEAQMHSYQRRLQALHDLKSEGYLLGSGIMIGLPFQTHAHLEEDLQFLKDLQVDMVGMGPYIPHKDTPLGQIVAWWKEPSLTTLPEHLRQLAMQPRGDFWNLSNAELLDLCIDMVARLRILMPHINIAATTALQVLHPDGREMALLAGANVIMPNMTESSLRGNYSLYEGKQGVADDAASTRDKLLENLARLEIPVGWNRPGDWR
ncbi:MAG: radical SAM protein [Bacteroidales bacterium]|nr:radical SAM protein [Bacteroidales bacterium]